MLADTRIAKIKTELAIWSPNRERVDNDKRLVVFKLSNQSNQLIKNMVILMNIPTDLDLYFGGGFTTSSAEFHEQAKTKILSFKQFEYLDSKEDSIILSISVLLFIFFKTLPGSLEDDILA